jgi:20S proteasome alpha/beta subunit
LEKAVKLADECMNLARQDLFSGGRIIDFAIITKKSIDYYGDSLREDLENFRKQKLDDIICKYI